ncbi:actin depolymerization factor/cofilin-like domain-containing protein [Streptomyces sp. NPDC003038]|uniref:actin-binding ADF family protein n=1 Tax=unclassified Streptomyces TaxID=2593676 RepID=UPI0033BB40BD
MSSDITVEDSCLSAFQDLKSKRAVNTVVFRLSDDLDAVVLDFTGNLTHEELLKSLPAAEPRFVVYDLAFATADGARRNLVVLISWCPEGTDAERRRAHSSAHGTLGDLLDGVQVHVQATVLAEVQYHELVARAS